MYVVYAVVRSEIFGSCSGVARDAGLIECDAVFGNQFMTFVTIIVPSSSEPNSPVQQNSLSS